MELFINNKSGAPIYDQIYNQIKQQIISGALQPDEAMPSIRGASPRMEGMASSGCKAPLMICCLIWL